MLKDHVNLIFSKPFVTAFLITFACSALGTLIAGLPYASILGALVISLILGMLFQVFRPVVAYGSKGIAFISNKFLRLGIILLGFKPNLLDLANAGVKTIVLAVIVVCCVIFVAYNLARKFGVDRHLAILAASGTGICGAAAVMGIASQLPADKKNAPRHAEDIVVAVAIVAILGTLFTLAEVAIRPFLGMTDVQFGVMAGASLHEIAHAVAAGGAAGSAGLDIAIIMKLSRVLLLAFAAVFIGIWYRRAEATAERAKGKVPIPWFMVGFVAASIIGTFVPLGTDTLNALIKVCYLVLGMAMAALGMTVNFHVLFTRGRAAFTACLITSVALVIFAGGAAKIFF